MSVTTPETKADRLGLVPGQKFFNLKQAAAVSGVSPDLIEMAVRSGRLAAKRSGLDKAGNPAGLYLVSAKALDAWFDDLADA